jgi:uncharacterized protein (DUF2336 family)
MASPASLLPELEDVVQNGTPERRTAALRRITTLFLDGAEHFREEHIAVFDDVMICLVEQIETKALAELARRLALARQTPTGVVRLLANDDNIEVAGPVLRQSKLDDPDLKFIAETKSQAHLLALSEREGISEALSDILVRRGDREVARTVAGNSKAQLSTGAFTTLVTRAHEDSVLAEKVGMRTDLPPRLFRELLMKAADVVQQRLLANARPETQAEIKSILAKVSGEVGAKAAPRNYTAALERMRELHSAGKLSETDIAGYAKDQQYEDMIAGLAVLCEVPVDVIDRLMNGARPDPVLILGRANSFSWETVRAIISSRPGARGTSTQALDAARDNFDKLTAPTAQRVVRFWQLRPGAEAPATSA